MPIPTSKPELLEAITINFQKLETTFQGIPDNRLDEKSMEGHRRGTLMSPADLMSYLIGWTELILKWLSQDDQGQAIEFPDVGYKWNELGLLAQKFYGDYGALSFDEKHQRFITAKDDLIFQVNVRSDEELYGLPWHGKWTKGRLIQLNSSSPYHNAKGRLRKWIISTSA